jgi:hypothetical protein
MGKTWDITRCKMSELGDEIFFFGGGEEDLVSAGGGGFVVATGFGDDLLFPHSFRWRPLSRHQTLQAAENAIRRRGRRTRYAIIEMNRMWEGPGGPCWQTPPTAGSRAQEVTSN